MLEVTKAQIEIINDKSRFKVIVAGRRWGKTHLSLFELLINEKEGLWKHPKKKGWYVSPTYRQSKQIAWNVLKEIVFEYPQLVRKKNESELSVEFINGSILELKGADNEDSLRGVGLNKLIGDEFSTIRDAENVWNKVLRPTLADKKGDAMFIGTPDGFNFMYEIFQKGKTGKDGFRSWHFKSIESPYLDPAEIEAARTELDEKSFRQEFEASFETATGRIYYTFDRKESNATQEILRDIPIFITVDFNVSPMCWLVIQNIRGVDYVIEELVRRNTNTEEMAKLVGDLYGYDRRLVFYGDYSGSFRSTKSPSTDYDIIRQILPNSDFRIKPNPSVVDRVNAVNARLCNAKGERRLFINIDKCPELVKDLEQVIWKEGKREIDKTNMDRTHSSDALGYYIEYEYSLKGKPEVSHKFRG